MIYVIMIFEDIILNDGVLLNLKEYHRFKNISKLYPRQNVMGPRKKFIRQYLTLNKFYYGSIDLYFIYVFTET